MIEIPPHIETAIIQQAQMQGLTAIELLAKDYATPSGFDFLEQDGIYSDGKPVTLTQEQFQAIWDELDDDTPNPQLQALIKQYGGLNVKGWAIGKAPRQGELWLW